MKLHRFRYSPYARKVQIALDLAKIPYEVVEVPYLDRSALVRLTGGYIQVPVLELDDGKAVFDSRVILEHIVKKPEGARLVPSPWEGPIWAYADWVDGPLEDVMFRIASPAVRDAWPSPTERALYVYIKERKFGPGCVDAWKHDQCALIEKARVLLEPTLRTLSRRPFLFGDEPTLADAALYGQCAMISEVLPKLVADITPELASFEKRMLGRARE